MRLILSHPEVAFRDCDDCRRHVYDEKTGRKAERHGRPIRRPAGYGPPCGRCPKGAPTGEPGNVELSAKNWKAYQHYRECAATMSFPDDSIVRRNAAVIRIVEESAEAGRQARALGPLAGLLRTGGGHGR